MLRHDLIVKLYNEDFNNLFLRKTTFHLSGFVFNINLIRKKMSNVRITCNRFFCMKQLLIYIRNELTQMSSFINLELEHVMHTNLGVN